VPVEHKLFAIVVWLGVIANWSFAVWAVFFDPHRLLATFDLGESESTLWLYNYSVLLMLLSLFYIPAAYDPHRYRANAWLLIVARLVPAGSFFVGVTLGLMPRGFLRLGTGDAAFGITELALLLRLVRTAGQRSGTAGWARAQAGRSR
jgi:hypothetical protein